MAADGDADQAARDRDLVDPTSHAGNGTKMIAPSFAVAIDNFHGAPRSVVAPLPTQRGSETMAVVSAHSMSRPSPSGTDRVDVLAAGVVPYRKNTRPVTSAEAMPTVTLGQIPGVITAAGTIQRGNSTEVARQSDRPADKPLVITQDVLCSGWYKQNGSAGTETAPHPVTDPLGTLTSRDTTAMLTAEWTAALAELKVEDCYFRMMVSHAIGRGCGFDVDFADHPGQLRRLGQRPGPG